MSQEEVEINDDLREVIEENEPFLNDGQRSLISFLASRLSVLERNASYVMTPSLTTDTKPSTEAASGSVDFNTGITNEHKEEMSNLWTYVQKPEKDIKQPKIKQILSEKKTVQDRETTSQAASGSADFNTGITDVHKEEMSNLWTYKQTLEEDTEQLKAKLKNSEDVTRNLQHQLSV